MVAGGVQPDANRAARIIARLTPSRLGEFTTQAPRELGYDSVLAQDAATALAKVAAPDAYHVVFSDVVMPGMSGIDLAQEIRRRYPDLPVILTSGYSHVLAWNDTHGFELLQKPGIR